MPSSSARTWSRSAMSQATTSAVAPSSPSSATSSATPSARGPERLTRTRWRTPCVPARCRATRAPSPLVPPVTRTVESAGMRGMSPSLRAGTSRGARTAPRRRASCGSPVARAAGRASADSSSMSTTTSRPGCSVCAERTRPHTGVCWRADRVSSGPVDTAPRVTTTSRESGRPSFSSHPWTASSARPATSSGASMASHSYITTGPGSSTDGPSTGVQSRRDSRPSSVGPDSSVRSGRERSRSTVTTGAFAGSVASSEISPDGDAATRTRSDRAPEACTRAPDQAKGREVRPGSEAPKAITWSAASSSAGCSTNAAADTSSGSATSA